MTSAIPEQALTPAQETEAAVEVADHVVEDLLPEGEKAWPIDKLVNGGVATAALINESGPLRKKITNVLLKDYNIAADWVNALQFRPANPQQIDPVNVPRYLPRVGRPVAGLRLRQGQDDPFAVASSTKLISRAASAMPRAVGRIEQQIHNGELSESTRGALATVAQNRVADVTTPDLLTAVRRMLPSAE